MRPNARTNWPELWRLSSETLVEEPIGPHRGDACEVPKRALLSANLRGVLNGPELPDAQ